MRKILDIINEETRRFNGKMVYYSKPYGCAYAEMSGYFAPYSINEEKISIIRNKNSTIIYASKTIPKKVRPSKIIQKIWTTD